MTRVCQTNGSRNGSTEACIRVSNTSVKQVSVHGSTLGQGKWSNQGLPLYASKREPAVSHHGCHGINDTL